MSANTTIVLTNDEYSDLLHILYTHKYDLQGTLEYAEDDTERADIQHDMNIVTGIIATLKAF